MATEGKPKKGTAESEKQSSTTPTAPSASTETKRSTPLQPGEELSIKIDNRSTYPITARAEFDEDENLVVTLEDAPPPSKTESN